ncbi:MAG TPA: sigma-70 family RNA polymerase sigma factor, partial [Candidatus Synoicihabitans sp.]|nr:sigma-70 family RNA polymerase sigma factor [Candidatus Synoicihabitans sp.]
IMNTNSQAWAAPGKDSAFPATRWSMVLNAGHESSSQAHAALETLCRAYWYPIYAFVRRKGQSHHEAEDSTQEFLTQLLASDTIGHARPERGRFRAYLLKSLQNFLVNEWHRASAAKRGGGVMTVSLQFDAAEERFALDPADPGLTPEQAFDRAWAHGLINHVVDELRAEYRQSGRGALFEGLGARIWSAANLEPSEQVAARLGLSVQAFDVALHRLRRRVGERLRAHVVQTVGTAAEVENELRHLVAALQN